MARSFRQSLVLHQWLLEQVAAPVWERGGQCNQLLQEAEREPWDEESPYLRILLEHRTHGPEAVPDGVLRRLDADIVAITRQLRVHRWLYFQYLAMLFAGLYLDAYYSDRDALLRALNMRIQSFNEAGAPLGEAARRGRGRPARGEDDALSPYSIEDLARLGCWQATGSGKTLLLHANRLQVFLYARLYEPTNRRDRPDATELLPPERTILLTPNRILVTHHAEEARALNVDVTVFDPALPMTREGGKAGALVRPEQGRLPTNGNLLGAAISQFQPPGNKHTVGQVPPEYFPGRTLVLVDEGHRGSSKVDGQWRAIREALAQGGFLFEYSATLEQAAKGKELRDYYARCIFIDYSYPKFYKDGYGKHHRILNLVRDTAEARHDYLVAALVAFHQQLDVFERHEDALRVHNIERPLMLFAGRTVTGETKKDEDKLEKVEEADIVKLLRFFALFVSGEDAARPMLIDILKGKPGILTRDQIDLFASYFPEVQERDAAALYAAVLRRVFRASAPGRLTLEVLKSAPGEVGVRVGEGEFFAVINVGKPDELVETVEKKVGTSVRVLPTEFQGGLFSGLKERDNRLTMLIGSKKFAEGWSSWRVSQIGLLHIGRGEGTQVIQLFGRGVRLKGKDGSLKRSSPPWSEVLDRGTDLSRIRVAETLNVFAIEADYLKRFEEQIEEMKKDDEDKRTEVELPVIVDERVKSQKLRVPVPPPRSKFVREVMLSLDPASPPPADIAPKLAAPIEVDFTPRVQVAGDPGISTTAALSSADLRLVRAFADHDELYATLVDLKNRKGWTNLALPRTVMRDGARVLLTAALLADDARFTVRLPSRYVAAGEVVDLRYLGLWSEIGRRLVTEHVGRFYQHCLGRWQTLNAKVQELDSLDETTLKAMFPPGWPDKPFYEVSFVSEATAFESWLGKLEAKVRGGGFLREEHPRALGALSGTASIYHPLLYRPAKANVDVRVRPVALNDGEGRFVERLHAWLDSPEGGQAVGDAEVFLLRNLSRTGLGFFVGRGFFPDFVLWVIRGDEQWVTFVDPKGLVHIGGAHDGKVRLAEDLPEVERRAGAGKTHLDAWLWSVTPRSKLDLSGWPNGFLANHVLFDEDGDRAVRELFKRARR